MAKEKFKSLAKVPKALRDEIFKGLQLGDSIGHMINRLEESGHKGFERRDLEHFGRWGEASFKALAMLVLALLLLATPAHAQRAYSWLNGGTNNCATGVTNYYLTSDYIMPIPTAKTVGVFASAKMIATGATSNLVFTFDASIDAVNWTTNVLICAFPASGTTTVFTNAVVDLSAYQYMRVGSHRNTNSIASTNLTVIISPKPL